MKLILCRACSDIFSLTTSIRACGCKKSWGQYEKDGIKAIYGGLSVPIGIANSSLSEAVKKQPDTGDGIQFNAFVIPKKDRSMRRINRSGWKGIAV